MRHGLLAGVIGWVAMTACSVGGTALADEPLDRVRFGVERTREVETDWVSATIGVTHEDDDPKRVAARINEDMTWALGIAKTEKRVEVRTSGYRTHPISDPKRGHIVRWRGGQDLVIEGSDAAVLSALLGRLQERLQLRGIQQSVSQELRKQVEDELIAEVVEAYQRRAARMAKLMGAKGHQLIEFQLNSPGVPQPIYRQTRGREMAMSADMAPPPIEGGTSTLHMGGSVLITLER